MLVAAAVAGVVASAAGATLAAVSPGSTVLLAPRTKTSGCTLSQLPDRRCSPGALSSGLTKTVICASGFTTSAYRNVPTSEKHMVEQEYGMAASSYGSSLEIDHIVSLELGGSNDVANLFPERASPAPGYHIKATLENKLPQLVCAGKLTLRAAQQQIASNWEALYKQVYGVGP